MAEFNEEVRADDVLKREFDPEFNRKEVTVAQDGYGPVADVDLEPGTVLEGAYSAMIYGVTGANATAILLEKVKYADLLAGSVLATALVRGPAVVDKDRLTLRDATLITKLGTLDIQAYADGMRGTTGTIQIGSL